MIYSEKNKIPAIRKHLNTTRLDEAMRSFLIFRAEIKEPQVWQPEPQALMASCNCLNYKEAVIVTLPNIMRLVQGQTTQGHMTCAQFWNSINLSHLP